MSLVFTNDNCIGCNKCIRVCPCPGACVAVTEEDGTERIQVDPARCIGCGACMDACKHGAREFEDDTEQFFADLAKGEKIPFDPTDATIYYVGPTPAKPGAVIGSAGHTTSGRMDAYAPTMMSVGARGMIGKGARLPEVVDAMKKYDGVYFGAIGGAGALLAKCIKKAELIAYEDLGAEALRKLYVEDMPLVVIIDSEGNNLYEMGKAEYLKEHGDK